MALNLISPFTQHSKSYREGLIATLLYNSGATKKESLKSIEDLFPYLTPDVPEYLEDDRVLKAKKVLESIKAHSLAPEKYAENYQFIIDKIEEEITLEMGKSNPDRYVIDKLKEIAGQGSNN